MLEELKAEAQQVLEDLFSEGLIPFALFAGKVECIAPDEYIIRFYDSQLYSVDVSWRQDDCFRDVFRVTVLQRVGRMTGSLSWKPGHGQRNAKAG
jgi:hypothetical protein